MTRHRTNPGHQHEVAALTAEERRAFRQARRGLQATDPDWYAARCPREARHARMIRCACSALSFALLVAGALTGVMPVVLGGIVLAVGVLTSHVSAHSGTQR